MLHSNAVEPKPSVALQRVSTNGQMIQSNVVPPYITIFLVWLKKIREQQKMIHDETKIRRVRSKSWTIDSWSRSRSRTRDSRPRRQRSQSRSRQTSLNSQVWMIIAEQLHLGCPRERFLAITSGTVPIFLQADRITYFPQHIKKLELAGVGTAIKFLYGGVLLKFWTP